MDRSVLINKTIEFISHLPNNRVNEVAEFAEFLVRKHEEETLRQGVLQLSAASSSFDFLKDEEELYSLSDLKERYK